MWGEERLVEVRGIRERISMELEERIKDKNDRVKKFVWENRNLRVVVW